MKAIVCFFYLAFKSIIDPFANSVFRARWYAAGVKIGRNVVFKYSPDAEIELAEGVTINSGALVIAMKEQHDTPNPTLKVGANTAINEYSNVRASGGRITIGSECIIAQFVSIIASNHSIWAGEVIAKQPWSRENAFVEIGNGVWVGAGATILPGVVVGDGAVIAAGAVVTKSIPDNEIWGGIPARFISVRRTKL
jgi:acetyltransferase-like isoleucine patch superfamily enzyme